MNGHVIQNGNCLTVPETVIEDEDNDTEILNAKNLSNGMNRRPLNGVPMNGGVVNEGSVNGGHVNGGLVHSNNKSQLNTHVDNPSDKQVFSMQNTVPRIENLMDKKQNVEADNLTADSGYIKELAYP